MQEAVVVAGDGGGRWTVPPAAGGRTDAMTMGCDGRSTRDITSATGSRHQRQKTS